MTKMMWRLLALVWLCQGVLGVFEPGAKEEAKGEEAKGEEAKGEGAEGNSGALILLGSVAMTMVMFYLVNSHVKGVSKRTWRMISSTISIFVAVMTYNMVNKLFLFMTLDQTEIDSPTKTWKHVLNASSQFLCWDAIVGLGIYCSRNSKASLNVRGILGGHMLGVAAIGLFISIAKLAYFEKSPWMVALLIIVFIVSFAVRYGLLVWLLLKWLLKLVKASKEVEEACLDQFVDTFDDMFAMACSALIAYFVKSVIAHASGRGDRNEWTAATVTPAQSWSFFGVGIAFALLTGTVSHVQLSTAGRCSGIVSPILKVATATLGMTVAWCMLGSCYWILHENLDDLTHIAVACIFSLVFVIVVFIFGVLDAKGIGDLRVMRAEFTAIAMALGLSWEKTFDNALEGAGHYGTSEKQEALITFFLTGILVCTVFPAWVIYILPKATEAEKELEETIEEQAAEEVEENGENEAGSGDRCIGAIVATEETEV